MELFHQFDNEQTLTHHIISAERVRHDRSVGRRKPVRPIKRQIYQEATLTDFRIASGMTLEEIRLRLIQQGLYGETPGLWVPCSRSHIIYIERAGSTRLSVISAFANLYKKPPRVIEHALSTPRRYRTP